MSSKSGIFLFLFPKKKQYEDGLCELLHLLVNIMLLILFVHKQAHKIILIIGNKGVQ